MIILNEIHALRGYKYDGELKWERRSNDLIRTWPVPSVEHRCLPEFFFIFFFVFLFYSSSLWCVCPLYYWGRGPQARVVNLSPSLLSLFFAGRELLFSSFFFSSRFSLPLLFLSFPPSHTREPGTTPFWVAWHRAPARRCTREFSHRNSSSGCVGLRSGKSMYRVSRKYGRKKERKDFGRRRKLISEGVSQVSCVYNSTVSPPFSWRRSSPPLIKFFSIRLLVEEFNSDGQKMRKYTKIYGTSKM